MNVGQPQNPILAYPSCFGSEEHYDPRNAECRGGADPKYTNPQTGSHLRPPCDVFHQCGQRVSQKASQVIPVRNLTKPGGIPLGPTSPAPPQGQGQGTTFADFIKQRAAAAAAQQHMVPHTQQADAAWAEHYRQQQLAQQLAQQQVVQQQRAAVPVPPQYPQPPQPYSYPYPPPPQNTGGQYHLNYMMPAYLSVPEVRRPGQSIWAILGRESVRAIGKSFGHTIAHFFDVNPFRE